MKTSLALLMTGILAVVVMAMVLPILAYGRTITGCPGNPGCPGYEPLPSHG